MQAVVHNCLEHMTHSIDIISSHMSCACNTKSWRLSACHNNAAWSCIQTSLQPSSHQGQGVHNDAASLLHAVSVAAGQLWCLYRICMPLLIICISILLLHGRTLELISNSHNFSWACQEGSGTLLSFFGSSCCCAVSASYEDHHLMAVECSTGYVGVVQKWYKHLLQCLSASLTTEFSGPTLK